MPEKRLIVSEKAVLLDELAAAVETGDVVEGVVGAIMDWGVFVECRTGAWRAGRGSGHRGGGCLRLAQRRSRLLLCCPLTLPRRR